MIYATKEVDCELGQEILLTFIGDVHYNTKDCDKDRFEALIPWLAAREKQVDSKVHIIGTGDYNDTFSPSERAALAAAKGGQGLHETSLEMLDSVLVDMTKTFYQVVKPVEHCFLGLLEGHHYGDIISEVEGARGLRTTEYLAKLIGCPYLGDLAVVKLNFARYGLTFTTVAMHGYGSARTPGAQLMKRVRMADVFEGADLYVMGHDNNKIVFPREPLRIGPDGKLGHHKQYFIGAGSFQRGYRFDTPYGNYVEKLALPPHLLGVTMVFLKVEERNGKIRLDYHPSS